PALIPPPARAKPASALLVSLRRAYGSGAVALLVLLAGAAPARVVAADVLDLALHDRLRRPGRNCAAAGDRRGGRGGAARGEDRVGAAQRRVLVAERAVPCS